MQEHVAIGITHWVYLLGVAIIVLTMIWRANVVVPSVIATFLVTLAWTHSPVSAVASIFNASFTAAKELFNIFLVIALIAALFGFTGIAAAAAGIAKFLFFLFLVICLIFFIIGISIGKKVT